MSSKPPALSRFTLVHVCLRSVISGLRAQPPNRRRLNRGFRESGSSEATSATSTQPAWQSRNRRPGSSLLNARGPGNPPRALGAFSRLTRKGWLTDRAPSAVSFATASVVANGGVGAAGCPGHDRPGRSKRTQGLENFAQCGRDRQHTWPITVIGATTFLWIGWVTTVLASDLRFRTRNLGTLPTIWASATIDALRTHQLVDRSDARSGNRRSWHLARLGLPGHCLRFPTGAKHRTGAGRACHGLRPAGERWESPLPWAAIMLEISGRPSIRRAAIPYGVWDSRRDCLPGRSTSRPGANGSRQRLAGQPG